MRRTRCPELPFHDAETAKPTRGGWLKWVSAFAGGCLGALGGGALGVGAVLYWAWPFITSPARESGIFTVFFALPAAVTVGAAAAFGGSLLGGFVGFLAAVSRVAPRHRAP